MIVRTPRERMGITLTEILISIMILGVGMVSLATLFPLGLLRLRDANRLSRSGTLTESATGDLEGRDLLNKQSFLNANVSPWYRLSGYTVRPYDPWVQDTPTYASGVFADYLVSPYGAFRGQGPPTTDPSNPPPPYMPGPGLPVAYDPLWRYQTGIYPGAAAEARFASGLGFVRPDPGGGGSTDPSAHGLQRITNFNPTTLATWMKASSSYVPDIFVSPEDMVLQSDVDTSRASGSLSPIVPEMSLVGGMPTYQNDWRYTWMFTGQQADCTNGTVFSGDIVVFENRPFGLNPNAPTYFTSSEAANFVEGEVVVEAIFGYTNNVLTASGGTRGYGATANRAVLLRWSDQMPDPEIRVGSWIADVTYERKATVAFTRQYVSPEAGAGSGNALAYFPYQRCYWYQIGKRTQAGPGVKLAGDPSGVNYRQMTVWVNTPLRAFTLLTPPTSSTDDADPVHVNAALVSPYVVNVFPRTIYTR